MKIRLIFIGLIIMSYCIIVSCSDETKSQEFKPTPYELVLPASLPKPKLPDDNPLTVEGIKLGNKLFFEDLLSGDNTMSCSGCHAQKFAFTDNELDFSVGIRDKKGGRNSMPIFNMFYHNAGFFWDGRAPLLRDQALMPIQDPLEMDETLENVVKKLKATKNYPQLFFDAFGTTEINPLRISLALEQYMFTLVSGNSKYDRKQAGIEEFTDSEKRGFDLFFRERDPVPFIKGGDCFHCHTGPNFSNNEFMNNGLDKDYKDLGYGAVTKKSSDNGKFKVPSLRNIAVSGPYMHDGRFKTLEEVIEHYNKGVVDSPTLDANMHGALLGLNFNEQDKIDLINFLKTLTDLEYLTNLEYKKNTD